MSALPYVALSVCVAGLIAVAQLYLARVRMPRPPVGVYAPGDIAMLCVGVVVAPLLYLVLPGAVVSGLFGLVLCLAVQFTVAPVRTGPLSWIVALAGAGLTVALIGRPVGVRVCTDVLLAVAVVGVANLWVQSGMRSAHISALATVLCCYDVLATTLTHVTTRFVAEVQGRPFAPILQLTGGHAPVALGLGDLLLLVLFPLAAAKAFGRTAALVAAVAGVAVTSVVSVLFALDVLSAGFPLLTALGPLIVAQHLMWTRRTGGERTTLEWRTGAPPAARPARLRPDDGLTAALAVVVTEDIAPDSWLAITDGRVIGVGPSPGLARRNARERGEAAAPVVRQL